MSATLDKLDNPPPEEHTVATTRSRRRHKSRPGLSVLAQGEPMMWLCGGALAICIVMIAGLLVLMVLFVTFRVWGG